MIERDEISNGLLIVTNNLPTFISRCDSSNGYGWYAPTPQTSSRPAFS